MNEKSFKTRTKRLRLGFFLCKLLALIDSSGLERVMYGRSGIDQEVGAKNAGQYATDVQGREGGPSECCSWMMSHCTRVRK